MNELANRIGWHLYGEKPAGLTVFDRSEKAASGATSYSKLERFK